MKNSSFWSEGIRFQCQGSGNCCVSRGGYGYVYLTLKDRQALAKELNLRTQAFTRRYCEMKDGVWKLKDRPESECVFLKNKRCSVYKSRPTQCRTWPFWPEALKAKVWHSEIASFCPGVGKGKLHSPAEVEEQLQQQIASENQYGS